jgi:hypothetical protein
MTPYEQAMDALRRGAQTRIAVVGASNNPEKYGNIIGNNLKGKGFTVLPINPREDSVAGLKAYRSLADLDGPVDIVDIVTPPPATLKVLEEAARLSLPLVWLQDGSWDDEVLEFARGAPFLTVHNACIMVAASQV